MLLTGDAAIGQAGGVITQTNVSAQVWEAETGWHLDQTGWCSGDRCIPVSAVLATTTATTDTAVGDMFDTLRLAEACGRAAMGDESTGTVAVGPAFGSTDDARLGRRVPDVGLVNRQGESVRLGAIVEAAVSRRRRLLIHAWAPW